MKIVLFFALIFAALAEPKKKGIRTQVKEKLKSTKAYHWGDNLLCGECRSKKDQTAAGPCNKTTGKCPLVAGERCKAGWDEEDPTCQTPVCDKVNCGSDGFCVAPNKCVCTQLSTQFTDDDGNVGCYHLRVAGLKGAGAALIVLIISVSACAGIQTAFSKKKNN